MNSEYGHRGGDVVLRQTASMLKEMLSGKDMVAHYGGDTFAVLLPQTTLHDALPMAEKIRKAIENTQFSHGSRPLHVTASLGIAQLHREEMMGADVARADGRVGSGPKRRRQHLLPPRRAGVVPGVVDLPGQGSGGRRGRIVAGFLVERFVGNREQRRASVPEPSLPAGDENVTLTGRSLFAANLNRRLSEWKRGGPAVSVAVVQVDQMDELITRFGERGQSFLRQVMGRLLEAATRDMDERCEFEDGLFALLLPGTDESNAQAVSERLLSQVRQCKVRMGNDLWDLTASIGLAHCTVANRVMDIMLSAEAAMRNMAKHGGDAVGIGQQVQEEAHVGNS